MVRIGNVLKHFKWVGRLNGHFDEYFDHFEVPCDVRLLHVASVPLDDFLAQPRDLDVVFGQLLDEYLMLYFVWLGFVLIWLIKQPTNHGILLQIEDLLVN